MIITISKIKQVMPRVMIPPMALAEFYMFFYGEIDTPKELP
jgi:hypothetical protein